MARKQTTPNVDLAKTVCAIVPRRERARLIFWIPASDYARCQGKLEQMCLLYGLLMEVTAGALGEESAKRRVRDLQVRPAPTTPAGYRDLRQFSRFPLTQLGVRFRAYLDSRSLEPSALSRR